MSGALLSVVSAEDLMTRWRWEKSKTFAVIASPGFPAPIDELKGRERRWLLLAVLEWELARSSRHRPAAAPPAAPGAPAEPPRGRAGRPRRETNRAAGGGPTRSNQPSARR